MPLLKYNLNENALNGVGYVSIGLIALVSTISIYVTNFHTLNIFFVLIYFLKIDKSNFFANPKNKINYSLFLKFLGVYVFVFFIQTSFYYSYSDFELKSVDQDIFYYSRLSSSLFRYGGEHTFFNDHAAANHVSVYHYFDLWICGFLSEFFGVPAYCILVFVVYPLLTFILVFVLLSFFELKNAGFAFNILLILFFLGFGAVFYDWYYKYSFLHNIYLLYFDNMPYTYYGRKLLPLLIVFGFIMKYYSKMLPGDSPPYVLFFIGVLIFPAVMFLPFVFALLLDLLVECLYHRNLAVAVKRNIFVYLLVCLLVLFLFFYAYNSRDISLISQSLFSSKDKFTLISNIGLSIAKLFYFVCLSCCSYLLHVLIVLLLNTRKVDYQISIKKFSFLIYYLIGGLFSYIVFYFYDSIQFATCNLALLNLTFFLFVFRAIQFIFDNRYFNLKKFIGCVLMIIVWLCNFDYHESRQNLPLVKSVYNSQDIETMRNILKNKSNKIPIEYYNTNAKLSIPLFQDFFILDLLGYNNFVKGTNCLLLNGCYQWNTNYLSRRKVIISNKPIVFGDREMLIDKSLIIDGPNGKEFFYLTLD